MNRLLVGSAALFLMIAGGSAYADTASTINDATLTTAKTATYSPSLVKAQVLLDRAHFSPGVIDGYSGSNMRRAIAAYAQANNIASTGALNDTVWQSLTASATATITSYTITAADAQGPFIAKVPTGDITAMSKLSAMSFTSPREALAEKFHMSEGLLTALNPGVDFSKAGTAISVASVASTPLAGEVATIRVNKGTNSVSAFDASNKLIGYFPATVGSSDRPAPSGTWAVQSVAFNPAYYYDPDRLTFGEGVAVGKLKVPPGPNNPVGDVWIDLTKDTYGIHGAPDPQLVGKVASHGCVRLTNWDATTLAKATKAGVKVEFISEEKS